jgi:hypothetical protein
MHYKKEILLQYSFFWNMHIPNTNNKNKRFLKKHVIQIKFEYIYNNQLINDSVNISYLSGYFIIDNQNNS